MPKSLAVLLVLTVSLPVQLLAQGVPKPLRPEFERVFRPNEAFAVVLVESVPALSIKGPVDDMEDSGGRTPTHYPVNIKDGHLKAAFCDAEPMAELERGEVMALTRLRYRKNSVELHMISLEPRSFRRGGALFGSEREEAVATSFRFYLPSDWLEEMTQYVERVLKFFPDQDAAQAYATTERPATARAVPPTPGPAAVPDPLPRAEAPPVPEPDPPNGPTREVSLGMTPLQTIDAVGRPDRERVAGDTVVWEYADFELRFVDGRLKTIRF